MNAPIRAFAHHWDSHRAIQSPPADAHQGPGQNGPSGTTPEILPPVTYGVVMEETTVLQVVAYLVADGIFVLAYRFIQRVNRCGARRQAVAYRLLPVMLCGALRRKPVQEATPRSDALQFECAALAHLDDGSEQRMAPYHVVLQGRYRCRRQRTGGRVRRVRRAPLRLGTLLVLEPGPQPQHDNEQLRYNDAYRTEAPRHTLLPVHLAEVGKAAFGDDPAWVQREEQANGGKGCHSR